MFSESKDIIANPNNQINFAYPQLFIIQKNVLSLHKKTL